MPAVQTAADPVDSEALGQTLMHEHVATLPSSVRANVPGAWDPERVIAAATARVQDVSARGVRTIADLTTDNVKIARKVPHAFSES